MKRLHVLLALSAGIVIGFCGGAALTVAHSGQVGFDYSQVVAKAGQTPVTRAQLAESSIAAAGSKLLDGELKRQAMIREAARQANITVTQQEVEARIKLYTDLLKQYEDLAELIGSQKVIDALPRWYLEDQFRHTLLAEKLLKISVTDEDIQRCYVENLKSFYKPPMVKAVYIATESLEDAQRAWNRLKDGEDPRKLSEVYSFDKSIRESRGDIGWIAQTGMRQEFADAIFKGGRNGDRLKKKEYTNIITIEENGKANYVIFYVEDYHESKEPKLSEVRPVVEFLARIIKLENTISGTKWYESLAKQIEWQRVKNLTDPTTVLEVVPAKDVTINKK